VTRFLGAFSAGSGSGVKMLHLIAERCSEDHQHVQQPKPVMVSRLLPVIRLASTAFPFFVNWD
jgi:hypothetical protein